MTSADDQARPTRLIDLLAETDDDSAAADLVADRSPAEAELLLAQRLAVRARVEFKTKLDAYRSGGNAVAGDVAVNQDAQHTATANGPSLPVDAADTGGPLSPGRYNALVAMHWWAWMQNLREVLPSPDPRWPNRYLYANDEQSLWAWFLAGGFGAGPLRGRVWAFGKFVEVEPQTAQRLIHFVEIVDEAIAQI